MLNISEDLAVAASECQLDRAGHSPALCGEQGLL